MTLTDSGSFASTRPTNEPIGTKMSDDKMINLEIVNTAIHSNLYSDTYEMDIYIPIKLGQ